MRKPAAGGCAPPCYTGDEKVEKGDVINYLIN